uniref:Origin recognition complex subunit 2 n=2 Tax=Babesia bovis TaxID=5865 RepID=A7AXB5_BABBO|eukprot:XP_001608756.1 hypothetical protein [Babesia bovis T2Bo]
MFSWKSWLINGIHICFIGMGSKRQLIRSFVEFALKDGTCLTIDGYKVQGTNCDGLWQYVERELFNRKESKSVADSKQTVLSSIAELDMPFYLVIYGIDLLVVHNTLKFLRPLLKISNVRVIGTMDHLRSGVVVPSLEQLLSNLRLVEVDTNVDYRSELLSLWEKHPPCYILREDQHKSASEMHAVISALNVNHRKLFSLIAEMQLAACSNGERFDGIEKYSLLRERRAITICNSESKLDALLTEFITHNLIQQSRGPGGKLYLMIPFPP